MANNIKSIFLITGLITGTGLALLVPFLLISARGLSITIDGLKDTYTVDENITFTVNVEGQLEKHCNYHTYPSVMIQSEGAAEVVYENQAIYLGISCDPSPSYVSSHWKYPMQRDNESWGINSTKESININEAGSYVLTVSFDKARITKQFAIASSIPEGQQPLPTSTQGPLDGEQAAAIRVALANDTVQELFEDKDMEIGVVRVSGVYSSQCQDHCAILILYQKESSEKHLAVMIDKLQERVVSIRPSKDWISADPDSLRVVEGGEYRVDFSFNEPLTKAEFGEIASRYGIKIEYFEYRATKNITGGVSTEVFADIDALEKDLRARHDAEIIGVHNLLARGQSEDLLRFIEEKRDKISELNVVEVIR